MSADSHRLKCRSDGHGIQTTTLLTRLRQVVEIAGQRNPRVKTWVGFELPRYLSQGKHTGPDVQRVIFLIVPGRAGPDLG